MKEQLGVIKGLQIAYVNITDDFLYLVERKEGEKMKSKEGLMFSSAYTYIYIYR